MTMNMTIINGIKTYTFTNVTAKDLEHLWTTKIGSWFFNADEKRKAWRQYKLDCKAKRLTPSEAYTTLWNKYNK